MPTVKSSHFSKPVHHVHLSHVLFRPVASQNEDNSHQNNNNHAVFSRSSSKVSQVALFFPHNLVNLSTLNNFCVMRLPSPTSHAVVRMEALSMTRRMAKAGLLVICAGDCCWRCVLVICAGVMTRPWCRCCSCCSVMVMRATDASCWSHFEN